MIDTIEILQKYYKKDSKSYYFLVEHSKSVKRKALEIAKGVPQFNPDLKFIGEAAMLHDIGILKTNEPKIGCYGEYPYVCHGYLGREILEKEGFPKHALVCERHVGVGITIQDILTQKLPLPKREMVPVTIEEEIICLADKFFSKNERFLTKEKSIEEIRRGLPRFGEGKLEIFDVLLDKYFLK